MNFIKLYRPACIGFEKEVVSFATTEELLAIPFVARFRELWCFHRYSICREHPSLLMLMAELNEGRMWWVIGYLSEDSLDLPIWKPMR